MKGLSIVSDSGVSRVQKLVGHLGDPPDSECNTAIILNERSLGYAPPLEKFGSVC